MLALTHNAAKRQSPAARVGSRRRADGVLKGRTVEEGRQAQQAVRGVTTSANSSVVTASPCCETHEADASGVSKMAGKI